MAKRIKIFLIAGEASSDRLGSKLMYEIRRKLPFVSFVGVGGKRMEAAGLRQVLVQKNFGIIGFLDIALRFFQLTGLIKKLAEEVEKCRPDLVITIDAWDFCWRVVAKLKYSGKMINTKFMHYVSPSVWLYRKGRINKMKELYDMLLLIFPFEAHLYNKVGMPCFYIGHPMIEDFSAKTSVIEFRLKHKIGRDVGVLGVMVGSRASEIARMLPIFIEAVEEFLRKAAEEFIVVWAAIDADAVELINQASMKFSRLIIDVSKLSDKDRISMIRSFDLALVKSGTSTLEVMLARVPMVVAYKLDWLSACVARYIFRLHKKLRHVCMVNILLQEEAVKEFVQDRCKPSAIALGLYELLDRGIRKRLLLKYEKVAKMLSHDGNSKPSELAAEIVVSVVR